MTNCPSPTAPWQRPVLNPKIEILTAANDAGAVSLVQDTTFLETTVLKATPTDPYIVALPAGNYKRQTKVVLIPRETLTNGGGSAPWKVTGTFSGFTYLNFSQIGQSAVLMWDGTGWQLIGGNAEPVL